MRKSSAESLGNDGSMLDVSASFEASASGSEDGGGSAASVDAMVDWCECCWILMPT